jgi:hypothetical protein
MQGSCAINFPKVPVEGRLGSMVPSSSAAAAAERETCRKQLASTSTRKADSNRPFSIVYLCSRAAERHAAESARKGTKISSLLGSKEKERNEW